MKKKLILCAVAAIIPAVALSGVPNMVRTSIPSIYYVTPSVKVYENTVSCQGTIQSENIYGVYASTAIVPGGVQAEAGDIVSAGDLLLIPDEEASKNLLESSAGGVIAEISESAADILPGLDVTSVLSSLLPGLLMSGGIESAADILSTDSGTEETNAVTVAGIENIYAPAGGVISEVNAVPGSPAMQGKPLFIIQDIKNYKVTAAVSEADISKISVGDSATIRGPGFTGTSFKGVVTKIYPTARKVLSGTGSDTVVDVEIKITAPNNKLRHGFSAKVEIEGGQRHEMITVPYEAIRQDAMNDEYVYIYEDGKLKKSRIITGREMSNEVEVLEGLSFDSIVIFNPDDVSGEGAIVNIKGRAGGA